jgi:hypothetical protein
MRPLGAAWLEESTGFVSLSELVCARFGAEGLIRPSAGRQYIRLTAAAGSAMMGKRTGGLLSSDHGGLPVEASCGGRTDRARRHSENPRARQRLSRRGRNARWQIAPTEIKTSRRGGHCHAKLTAHGFPPRLLQAHQVHSSLEDRRHGAGRSCQKATRPHSTQVAVQRLFSESAMPTLHRADGDGCAWRPALPPVGDLPVREARMIDDLTHAYR